MGFWGSLFGGSNPTLNSDINQFGQIGGFATGLGEKNLSQASNFWSSILSGDPTQTAKSLAPQISTIEQQAQQQRNTGAQFGNRSGGTNASNQMIGDQATGSINNMISSLLGSSASNLGNSGAGLLSQGASAYGAQEQASQQRMQNWMNSILGKGITGAVQAGESAGLGAAGGALPGGPGAAAGAQAGLSSFWG
jgi:hypothetical protein